MTPSIVVGNVNAAAAALRNWVLNLHEELDGIGIQAAHIAIDESIRDTGSVVSEKFQIALSLLKLSRHQLTTNHTRIYLTNLGATVIESPNSKGS